jgi:signal transduction histidine kinase/ligand-binding sensor domain-containing protein/DNA-binding response OmpR family regulator
MKYPIFTFLLILCFIQPIQSSEISVESRINFKQISLKEGLSQSTVFNLLQDSLGYIWVATADGLNRYDGYKFIVYKTERNKPNSIMDNNIWSMYLQNSKYLWVGTGKGISCFDVSKNSFENFPKMEGSEKMWVYQISEWKRDEFLLATNLGLYFFTKKEGYRKLNFPSKVSASAIFRINSESVLIGSFDGLYVYYPQKNTFKLVDRRLKGINVAVLLPQKGATDKYWLGTEGAGAVLYNIKTSNIEKWLREASGELSSDFVRSMCYDNLQRLWLGTFVGLNILNEYNGAIQHIYHTGKKEGEIAQNSVRALYLDKQNGMWCGTFYGGLNYYHALKNQFEHIRKENDNIGLNDNVVSVLKEDSKGNIWIATNENGINVLNWKTGAYSYFRNNPRNPNSLTANNVKALLEENGGNFWIGTQGGGFCRYNAQSSTFKRINISSDPVANNRVYALLQTPYSGKMLIGTLRGLYWFDKTTVESDEFSIDGKFPLHEFQILSLFCDSRKIIWIGTNYGFYRYDSASRKLDKQSGRNLNLSLIHCFHEDKYQRVWIGAKDGLFCYNMKTGAFDKEFATAGFPEYMIHGIEEDDFDNLWLGTGSGLISFNMQSLKWRIYTESDGVQSNQFSPYSHLRCSNGKMYFGGINGITSFYPERMIDNPYAPIPLIDKLTVFNKTVLPDDETRITNQSIDRLSSIQLKPEYNVFGLEFVVPNYVSGQKNTFSYKLEGFDEDWYTTEKTSVSYSNLQPGKYTFHIKAANGNGRWSLNERRLVIIILPHWYETLLAKFLFAILFITITIALVRFYLGRKLIANELELERKDKERIKELDQAKIRFFVNVSHEFRTPLTLILSPVREMLSKGVKELWVKKQLQLIERNADRMLHLINQVLDYRKTELGAMPLQVRHEEIEPFVRQNFELFTAFAQSKGFNYFFNSTVGEIKVYFDRNFIERILSNLLGNAFKYTTNNGTIELNLSIKDNFIRIEVVDNGLGIAKEKFDSIFDRFYQQEENAQGTGIGLSLVKNLVETHHGKILLDSELNKGSKFTVLIPAEKSSYTKKEFYVTNEFKDDSYTETNEVFVNTIEPTADDVTYEKQSKDERLDLERPKRLMIVEDDEEIRNYLNDQLSQKYDVQLAENGKEAWDSLNEKEVDLILSDVMMPQIDGVTLCKMVKQNIHFSHIPFILLTAKNDISDQLKGLQTGADDYIGKPFVYSIIDTKITNIFRQHSRIIARYATNPDLDPHELVSNPLDEEFLNKAVIIVEKNLDNSEFSVEEFSSEMFMSRSGLHLKMKALTGESAGDFIRKVRLSNACKMLKEGRYNVAEISTMIGMSPTYFSTTFKKHIGYLPSEYVKTLQNKQG